MLNMKLLILLVILIGISAYLERDNINRQEFNTPKLIDKLKSCKGNECSHLVRKHSIPRHELCLWKCANTNCYEEAINGINLDKVFRDTPESKKLMQVMIRYWNDCNKQDIPRQHNPKFNYIKNEL